MRYLRTIFCVLLVLLFATSALADDDNRRVSKKQKYSDNGAKCKSVRSGNAALCGRAMLGSDGVTLLELNTNDPNGRPAGTILKVVVKPKHEDMPKQRFDNVNVATFSVSLNGLEKNDEIKVEAQVRGLDGKKREINLKVPVLLRANLAVVSLDAPIEARTGVPIIVTAFIENHGDFGANADCVLFADGVQVDIASENWIDVTVGDEQVSCQLTHTFATDGVKILQVSLNNVAPGDFDTTDNAAATQINIVPNPFLGYIAFARERQSTTEFLDGSRPSVRTVNISSSLNGTLGALDLASAAVTADEYTGAAHISSTFDLELQNGCLKNVAKNAPRFISICRAPTGETQFSLSRVASINYQSSGVDAQGAQTYVITASQGLIERFGATYEFRIRLWDLSNVYEANQIINLIETNTTSVMNGIRFSQRLLTGTVTGPIE